MPKSFILTNGYLFNSAYCLRFRHVSLKHFNALPSKKLTVNERKNSRLTKAYRLMTGGPIGTGSEGTFDFFFFPSKRNPEPVKACHNGEKYFCVRFVNDITNLSFNLLACFLENTETNFHFSFLFGFRGIRKLVVLIWAYTVYSNIYLNLMMMMITKMA